MLVSVITPFYLGNEYMEKYQQMLLGNEEALSSEDSLEVLIINDSPDTVVKLQGRVAAKRNWHVIANDRNLGIHASRIHGLLEAKGDYVLFLDQDDYLREDAISCFLSFIRGLDMEAGYQVIVSNAILEQENVSNLWYRKPYHKSLVGNLNTYLTIGTQIISPGQCLIPRSLIPDYWITHPCTRNGADDYFLWILLLELGVPFLYLDEPLYTHHFTSQNLSSDTSVTDESSYQFIEFMRQDHVAPEDDLNRLEDMLHYKASFRKASLPGKMKLALRRMDILIPNLIFKIRTGTHLGFNR